MGVVAKVRRIGVGILLVVGTIAAAAPGALAAGDDVKFLNYGDYHGCAVKTDRSVWCWGLNEYHQMGDGSDGTDDDRFTPVRVQTGPGAFLKGITGISPSGYDHTCARKSDGTVRCWGENTSGQLGDGTTDERLFPVKVKEGGAALGNVSALAVGQSHSCARVESGTARCWGSNISGQLGDGTSDQQESAVTVRTGGGAPLKRVAALAAGFEFTCALRTDGGVRCWGRNQKGQLGIGIADDDDHLSPLTVLAAPGKPLAGVIAVDAGARHACALMANRTVRCWGENNSGELGDGTQDDRPFPVKVRRGSGFLDDVVSLSAGANHTCAVTGDGKAWCWGDDSNGEIGNGDTVDDEWLTPQRMRRSGGSFGNARLVRAGDSVTCVLRRDQTVWCTGYSEYGQIGSGTTEIYTYFLERVDFP